MSSGYDYDNVYWINFTQTVDPRKGSGELSLLKTKVVTVDLNDDDNGEDDVENFVKESTKDRCSSSIHENRCVHDKKQRAIQKAVKAFLKWFDRHGYKHDRKKSTEKELVFYSCNSNGKVKYTVNIKLGKVTKASSVL